MNFRNAIKHFPHIITEGSIIERLKREFHYPLDNALANALMIYDEEGKELLESIYRGYIEIAESTALQIMLLTPTWRANKERTKNANVDMKKINTDAFLFVDKIRKSFGCFSEKIFIGGLTGCKGDAYKPTDYFSTQHPELLFQKLRECIVLK